MVDETNVVKIMKDDVMLSAAKLVAQYPPTVAKAILFVPMSYGTLTSA